MKKYFLLLTCLSLAFAACQKAENTGGNSQTGHNDAVTGILLEPKEISAKLHSTFEITVTITPETAANKNVKWTYNDVIFSPVDGTENQFYVANMASNPVYIKATTEDGSFADSCLVTTLFNDSATAIQITPDADTLQMEVGDSLQLGYKILPETACQCELEISGWTYEPYVLADDPTCIITVSGAQGLVRAIQPGFAKAIVETNNGCTDEVVIEVLDPGSLNPTVTHIWAGGKVALNPTRKVKAYTCKKTTASTLLIKEGSLKVQEDSLWTPLYVSFRSSKLSDCEITVVAEFETGAKDSCVVKSKWWEPKFFSTSYPTGTPLSSFTAGSSVCLILNSGDGYLTYGESMFADIEYQDGSGVARKFAAKPSATSSYYEWMDILSGTYQNYLVNVRFNNVIFSCDLTPAE